MSEGKITQGIPVEQLHTDVMTDKKGLIEEGVLPSENSRFKAHALLSHYFPDYFPKIVLADKEQITLIKKASTQRLSSGSRHRKQLEKAADENVYVVERILDPTWKELENGLTSEQHLRVAINVLEQLNAVFRKTGIVLADRNAENIFVSPELVVTESDFGEVYDPYSLVPRDVNLTAKRDTSIEYSKGHLDILRKTVGNILSLAIVSIGINDERRDDVVEKLHQVDIWLQDVTLTSQEAPLLIPTVITKLETIWKESF